MRSLSTLPNLKAQGAVLDFQVILDMDKNGVFDLDISQWVQDIPIIRSGVQPNRKTPELANVSVLLHAANGFFDEWNTTSPFYGVNWHDTPIKIGLGCAGVRVDVVNGILADIATDPEGMTAELTVIDLIGKLKRDNVASSYVYDDPDGVPLSGDEVGKAYRSVPPGEAIKDLLVTAGLTSKLDSASFDTEGLIERAGGMVVREYLVQEGSYWGNITPLLEQASAGIRQTSAGLLQYFKYAPVLGGSVMTLHVDDSLGDYRRRRPSTGVENKIKVTRQDFDGSKRQTGSSPLQDSASQTKYGVREAVHDSMFTSDAAAQSAAAERLAYNKEASALLERVVAPIEAFVLELFDVVTLADPAKGYSVLAQVMSQGIRAKSKTVELDLLASLVATNTYLFTNNSQVIDGTARIW